MQAKKSSRAKLADIRTGSAQHVKADTYTTQPSMLLTKSTVYSIAALAGAARMMQGAKPL